MIYNRTVNDALSLTQTRTYFAKLLSEWIVGRSLKFTRQLKVNFFDLAGAEDFADIRKGFYENTSAISFLLIDELVEVDQFEKQREPTKWNHSLTHIFLLYM